MRDLCLSSCWVILGVSEALPGLRGQPTSGNKGGSGGGASGRAVVSCPDDLGSIPLGSSHFCILTQVPLRRVTQPIFF